MMARAFFEKVLSRRRDNSRVPGDAARDRGDLHAAADLYRDHLRRFPQDAAIWIQLGHCLKDSRRFEEAATAYQTACDLTPSDHDLLLNFGHLRKLQDLREDAICYYRLSFEAGRNPHAARELLSLTGEDIAGNNSGDLLPRHSPDLETERAAAVSVFEWYARVRLNYDLRRIDPTVPAQARSRVLLSAFAMDFCSAKGVVRICNIHFQTSTEIHLRLENSTDEVFSMDVWQADAVRGSQCKALATGRHISAGHSLVVLREVHPLLPLVLIFRGHAGEVVHSACFPFPSLLIGGLHSSERAAIGLKGRPLDDLRYLSAALMSELLDQSADSVGLVSEVRFECGKALGTECMFDPVIHDWLTGWVGIDILIAGYLGGADRRLPSKMDRGRRPSHERLVLRLPAIGLPTLSSLLRRLYQEPKSSGTPNLMLVEGQPGTRAETVLLSVPAGVTGVCPDHGVRLSSIGREGSGPTSWAADWPLAVLRTRRPVAEPIRPAGLVSGDWLPSSNLVSSKPKPSVCVVIDIWEPSSVTPASLAGILRQSAELQAQVFLSVRSDMRLPGGTLKDAQSGYPHAKLQIVEGPDRGVLVRLREAAERSNADVLLSISQDVQPLHDQALQYLSMASMQKGVGSVSCALAETFDGLRTTGGYGLRNSATNILPSLTFEPIDLSLFQHWQCLAVCFNTLSFTALRKNNLFALPSSSLGHWGDAYEELIFGLDLLCAGKRNVLLPAALAERLQPSRHAAIRSVTRSVLGRIDIRERLRSETILLQKIV